jgi:hypothetical protein
MTYGPERKEPGPRLRCRWSVRPSMLAVLLFGLTTSTGAIDVVSVVTAIAGAGHGRHWLVPGVPSPRPHPSV